MYGLGQILVILYCHAVAHLYDTNLSSIKARNERRIVSPLVHLDVVGDPKTTSLVIQTAGYSKPTSIPSTKKTRIGKATGHTEQT